MGGKIRERGIPAPPAFAVGPGSIQGGWSRALALPIPSGPSYLHLPRSAANQCAIYLVASPLSVSTPERVLRQPTPVTHTVEQPYTRRGKRPFTLRGSGCSTLNTGRSYTTHMFSSRPGRKRAFTVSLPGCVLLSADTQRHTPGSHSSLDEPSSHGEPLEQRSCEIKVGIRSSDRFYDLLGEYF